MKSASLPPLWLIVLIVGLTQLSETVYSPSLPAIAHALHATESMVEYTLTIYLFGFAIGTLFWGKLSDKLGRKPCILGGLFIFILGSIGCYFSDTITNLMVSRFIQAFGGSIGSVLGQAICRDSFQGAELGKVYSSLGGALAFFPAIGPFIGGLIAENFGWPSIFIFLAIWAILLSMLVITLLPETHHSKFRQETSIIEIGFSLLKDKKVMGLGIIVGACNGISFSYYAEAPFYLISILGLSPSHYGLSFIIVSISIMLGGIISTKLHNYYHSRTIMKYGIIIMVIASAIFSSLVLFHIYITSLPDWWMIAITIASQTCIMFGVCIANSNALAIALVDYKWCIGTASSLFGFFYYCLISLCTLGMGALHNGTLLPMPLYFLTISMFILFIQKLLISK